MSFGQLRNGHMRLGGISKGSAAAAYDPVTALTPWHYSDPSIAGDVTQAANVLQRVNDKSGNARHMDQTTNAGNRPSWGIRKFNDLDCIDWDGVNDWMSLLSAGTTLGNGNWTMIVPIQIDTAPLDMKFFGGQNGGTWNFGLRATFFGTKWAAVCPSGQEAQGAATDTAAHMLVGRRTGTILEIMVDGAITSINTAANAAMLNGFVCGYDQGGGGQDWTNGITGAFLVTDYAMTNAQINTHCAYEAARWGTPAWAPI